MQWLGLAVVMLAVGPSTLDDPAPSSPSKRDDLTFRPTVIVRKGTAQGTGTIVSSTANATLVLTAAHVVSDAGPLRVELHRYNLGLEDTQSGGPWPKRVAARVVARDSAGDVAVLKIEGLDEMPYVAELADLDELPDQGTPVTSIGIDLGTDFKSWDTSVRAIATMSKDEKEPRLFLLTEQAPQHGRSGGGLFLKDGALLGVCIGRIEQKSQGKERAIGLFAAGPTIRRVLREAVAASN